jgi:hypothetical protein
MNLPDVNPGGYINASISNVTGFHNVDYLLAHGSGDDNVHYANSAHLLDMLTQAQVRSFRFRMFTDRYETLSDPAPVDRSLPFKFNFENVSDFCFVVITESQHEELTGNYTSF